MLLIYPLVFGTWEIVLIVLVILLLFGGKKIPELMKGLGKGVKSLRVKNLNGILRLSTPFVRTAKGKGRFRTLLSVTSNFAHLKLPTEVMQRSVCEGELYPSQCYN